jgi:hypothetical protein
MIIVKYQIWPTETRVTIVLSVTVDLSHNKTHFFHVDRK